MDRDAIVRQIQVILGDTSVYQWVPQSGYDVESLADYIMFRVVHPPANYTHLEDMMERIAALPYVFQVVPLLAPGSTRTTILYIEIKDHFDLELLARDLEKRLRLVREKQRTLSAMIAPR